MSASKMKFAILALFAGSAIAADATLETARRCVQVKDSLERLVCFDRAFAGAPAAAAAAVSPAAPLTAPVKAAPAPVPAVVAAPPALGDDSVKRSVKTREAEAGPTSLTAVITELKETRPSVFRMTLDNGNVWQQMDLESLFYVKVGDTVKIEKGRMGGYRMARVSGNGSGWARVNRVK
ncbi:MAG: hypothetical protein ABIP38_06610 [Steroidobacteraceae bacterium]